MTKQRKGIFAKTPAHLVRKTLYQEQLRCVGMAHTTEEIRTAGKTRRGCAISVTGQLRSVELFNGKGNWLSESLWTGQ